MTELCDRFGVSRKTGYKWLNRFAEVGLEGLEDHSRAPQSCPHVTPPKTVAALVRARQAHPTWGPKKLVPYLARTQPELALTAPSTAGDVLKREGLIPARKRRRKFTHPGSTPLVAEAPNAVWMADFKGEFATRDGRLCYPLTVTDAHSRFLIACWGLLSTECRGALPIFTRMFQEYGLPAAIRTDNGTPFVTVALGGLSRLNVYWIKLGIRHQRNQPAHPEQNGRHERMHRTLKAETTRPPAGDLRGQQTRFAAFQAEFNYERPHEALAQQTPSTCYVPALRPFPAHLPEPEYAGHLSVRRVGASGSISFSSRRLFVSEVLAGEWVGLEEVDEDVWSLYFYDVLLGRFHVRDWQIHG